MIKTTICALVILLSLCKPTHSQATAYTIEGDSPYDDLGRSIASLKDVNGDGYADLAIGVPVDHVGGYNAGSVRVVSGYDGTTLSRVDGTTLEGLGRLVKNVGDTNGDGIDDLVVASNNNGTGSILLLSGAGLTSLGVLPVSVQAGDYLVAACSVGDVDSNGWADFVLALWASSGSQRIQVVSLGSGSPVIEFTAPPGANNFGFSIDGSSDFNGDGFRDVIVGSPNTNHGGFNNVGRVDVYSIPGASILMTITGTNPLLRLGSSVAGGADVSGDGVDDILAGAPGDASNGSEAGSVLWYSGADASFIGQIYGVKASEQFGSFVRWVPDLDADGRSDILATSQVQTTALTAYYHSSVTLAEVIIVGGDGKSVAHVPDLNGDGLDDLALGGVGIANSGRVTVHLVGCSQPIQYCNGKTNSLGCTPSIEAVGSPSVSVADNLVLVAKSVLNNKPGLLIWSPSWAFLPFGGGTLCVGSPLKRTPAQTSGGNSLPIQDCSGNYGFHFSHSYALANGLGPGQEFYAQYWSRDQGFTPPNNIGLTDAVCVALFP